MRMKRNEVKTREEFVASRFFENPTMTVKEVNDLLYTKFGRRMNVNRVYALRKMVNETIYRESAMKFLENSLVNAGTQPVEIKEPETVAVGE